jgi:hypothetical protein
MLNKRNKEGTFKEVVFVLRKNNQKKNKGNKNRKTNMSEKEENIDN